MIKIQPSGDFVQLIYVDSVSESVQEELKSDSDAVECSYGSNGRIYMKFGRMTFEYTDPTEFEINGSAVIDAIDFVTKLTSLFPLLGGEIRSVADSPIMVNFAWAGSQVQYDAIVSPDPNTIYFIVQ